MISFLQSYIAKSLPDEYKGMDIGKLLAVFCTKDSNGIGCYNQLPVNNFDMVSDGWLILMLCIVYVVSLV